MTAPPDSKHLQLSVTNLGPIARADIDLRPMTVFVGPSNTGKSYLATLVYALHRAFGGRWLGTSFIWRHGISPVFGISRHIQTHQPISPEEIDALTKWLDEMLHKVDAEEYPELFSAILPESIAGLVRHQLKGDDFSWMFLDMEIARCFGIEKTSDLVRNQVKSGARVTMRRPTVGMSTASTSIGYDYTIRGKHREFATAMPIEAPLQFISSKPQYMEAIEALTWLDAEPRSDEEHDARMDVVNTLLRELAGAVGSQIVTPLSHPAYYLPADRTGVMHAHRTVVRSMIGQASRAGLQSDAPVPQLSGVLADFLEQLIGLDGQREGDVEKTLAQQIEKDILQGEISMEQSPVGYPEFFYRPKGWNKDLGLMNTSSMVSELAPVVLYLRHVVRPGDVLIIEEPESSLHPAMQVEFVRHLAAAVHAGVRIMITTHSEWVLDELTNLVHLFGLPETRRDGIGGADFALDPDDVGVWLFEPKMSPKGTVVKEIPFDVEFGGFRSGFDDVAVGTYNDYARISNRIAEVKAEYDPR